MHFDDNLQLFDRYYSNGLTLVEVCAVVLYVTAPYRVGDIADLPRRYLTLDRYLTLRSPYLTEDQSPNLTLRSRS